MKGEGGQRRMAGPKLTADLLELVAERFRALGEPSRLQILNALRVRELTVSELLDETGLSQANASKHLQLLHTLGFVDRRREGLHVYYRLTDDSVFDLCDIMCGRLSDEAQARSRLFTS
jgi:DNA-binding transcriptional ArsR family regulator